MSMDMYVLSRQPVSSIKEWQANIDQMNFYLNIDSIRDLTVSGHLPARWNGREAGFECGPIDVAAVLETYDIDFGGPWSHAYVFYFSNIWGCLGAVIASAAYARAADGIVFDPQDELLLTPEAAEQSARKAEVDLPPLETLLNKLRS